MKKIIYTLFITIIMLFSHIYLVSLINIPEVKETIYLEKTKSDTKEEVKPLKLEYDKTNEDIVGRLVIKSLDIDEEVFQGENNDYYLNHDRNGNYYIWGNVVLDYRNNMSDREYYIFGHNSRTKNNEEAKFQKLENYTNKEFFEKGEEIYLAYGDTTYKYKPLLVKTVISDNEHTKVKYSSDEDFLNHVAKLRKDTIFDTGEEVTKDDQILVLQTCYYKPVKSLLLVIYKRVN